MGGGTSMTHIHNQNGHIMCKLSPILESDGWMTPKCHT
jgi:hypothetical protein